MFRDSVLGWVLASALAAMVTLLALTVRPQGPDRLVVRPEDGIVVFQPGEARAGDTIVCPGLGSVPVQEPGGRAELPGGPATWTWEDGAVFASCEP
ncbi:MAG TPA: hypothetical protein VJN50_09095 [Actinomycetota bacterium]|nr:hypothetical protein [Actinomycetota bacterium]